MRPCKHSVFAVVVLLLAGCAWGTGLNPERASQPELSGSKQSSGKAAGSTDSGKTQNTPGAQKSTKSSGDGKAQPESATEQASRKSVPKSINLSEGRSSLARALSNATRQLENKSQKIERLRSRLSELKAKHKKKQQKISDLQAEMKKQKSRLKKLQKAVKKWKKKVIGFRNEMRSAEEAEMQALKQVIALLRRSGRQKGSSSDSQATKSEKETDNEASK